MRIEKSLIAEKTIKAELIFPFVKEILSQGKQVRITVTGSSMYPFLRENIDSVELSGCSLFDLRRGDIALIKRGNGQYILHRVLLRKADSFFIVGDAQQWVEGPVYEEQLIAIASAIYRTDFRISCSGGLWRIVSFLWLKLLPYRRLLIKGFRKSRKIMKDIMKCTVKFTSRGRPLFEKLNNKN